MQQTAAYPSIFLRQRDTLRRQQPVRSFLRGTIELPMGAS